MWIGLNAIDRGSGDPAGRSRKLDESIGIHCAGPGSV